MKIAIDLTPLYNRKATGVENYGIDFYRAILKTRNDIYPIFRKENSIDKNVNTIIVNLENRLVVENLFLSKVIREKKIDIVFFPIFPPPFDLYFFSSVKIIPTIHDLTVFRYPKMLTNGAKYYLKPKYRLALKHSYKIITISETIKRELSTYTEKPLLNFGENISCDFFEINKKLNEKYLLKWSLKKYEYFISVSTIEPRKNLKYLLSIILELRNKGSMVKLVLVGRKGWGKDKELERLITLLGESIIFTGFITINELITLYHYSKAFFLLSLYEGFGRTPLEAVACGCKNIFVSDIPIFHENLEGIAQFLPLDANDRCIDIINKHNYASSNNKNIKLPFDKLENNITKLLEFI